MQRTKTQLISGWGNVPRETCYLLRPEKYRELLTLSRQQDEKTLIARGQGKSYGDASLNKNNLVVLSERLNRFIAFDPKQGILTAEAGVTLQEILAVIVPKGWFLPVTPGTQMVSLGGCVASDVHGKNHHKTGSIGQHILSLELITADSQMISCSPENQSELFWATIGGMGLTGIIGKVTLTLIPISSAQMDVRHFPAHTLRETFDTLNNPEFDDDYSVAWIDTFRERSIIMTGHHAISSGSSENLSLPIPIPTLKTAKQKSSRISLPFYFPDFILNKTTINLFNQFYFSQQSKKTSSYRSEYQRYFYPLDNILHWNKLYGKKGFVQYQCVIPEESALEGLSKILSHQCSSFLAVLKRLGPQNQGLFSFPLKGYTLALDIRYEGKKTEMLLQEFNAVTLDHGGRVYLTKDAFLSPEDFRRMYPACQKFLEIKNRIDPHHFFQSSLSRRLKLHD